MDAAIKQALELHNTGKLNEAAQIYNRILQVNPHHADALHLLGLIAFQQSNYEQSKKLLERALALSTNQPIYHHNMGSTMRVLGEFDKARRHYRTAIRLKPSYAEAYFNFSAVQKFREPDEDFIEGLMAMLNRPATSELDQCFLHFAAGKYFDDQQEYDLAFEHYRAGNDLKQATFDTATYESRVQAIIDVCDKALIENKAPLGHRDQTPVFIVGMPRSGTTLAEQILSSHPEIFGAGELPDIPSISRSLSQHSSDKSEYPTCLRSLTNAAYEGFGSSYIKRLRQLHKTANRIVDKNPINHQHVGLILSMLPDARIIHCHRETLDTCLSCYFQNFRSGQEFSYSFEDICTYYNGYRRLMNHWRSVAPDRILDFCYEDVVDDLEQSAKRLIDFLKLEWDENCLQFHQSVRPVATASDLQVRQPIYRSSVKRWQNYEKHLPALIAGIEHQRN